MMHPHATRLLAVVTALTLGVTIACSDDDDGGGGSSAGTTSTGGTRAMGGTAGTGGIRPDGGTATGGEPTPAGGEGGTGGTEAEGGRGGLDDGGAGDAGLGGGATLALSDAQIVLVLDTLNQGEVEEAYAALPRLMEADVEAFAEGMVMEHGGARESVLATAEVLGLNPEPSSTQRALKSESESHVALLRSAPGDSVDAEYIDLQVNAHAAALELLSALHDAADASELADLIVTLRTTVEEHHEAALSLQREL